MLPPQARFQERRVQLDPGRDVGAERTGSAEIATESEAKVAESQPDTILPRQRRARRIRAVSGASLCPRADRNLRFTFSDKIIVAILSVAC